MDWPERCLFWHKCLRGSADDSPPPPPSPLSNHPGQLAVPHYTADNTQLGKKTRQLGVLTKAADRVYRVRMIGTVTVYKARILQTPFKSRSSE